MWSTVLGKDYQFLTKALRRELIQELIIPHKSYQRGASD
jgi:hypothetical protein